MFKLSETSERRLSTCAPIVQEAVWFVLNHIDVGILCGHRDKATQNRYYDEGKTKVRWPNSDHNTYPSNAVDLVIFVRGVGYIDETTEPEKYMQYYGFLAGLLKGWASNKGIELTWGGDWDRDANFNDQRFDDLVHFAFYLGGE